MQSTRSSAVIVAVAPPRLCVHSFKFNLERGAAGRKVGLRRHSRHIRPVLRRGALPGEDKDEDAADVDGWPRMVLLVVVNMCDHECCEGQRV